MKFVDKFCATIDMEYINKHFLHVLCLNIIKKKKGQLDSVW